MKKGFPCSPLYSCIAMVPSNHSLNKQNRISLVIVSIVVIIKDRYILCQRYFDPEINFYTRVWKDIIFEEEEVRFLKIIGTIRRVEFQLF